LFELSWARDGIARELDLPPSRVVPNDLLLRFGELDAKSGAALERRLPVRFRAYAPRFVAALVEAEHRDDAPREELPEVRVAPSATELARQKRRRELLIAFRTREATERGVDPQAVLPGHCVNEMVKLDELSHEQLASVPGLGHARIDRYVASWQRELGPRWSS
jgi:ribonuclease D